MEVNRIPKTDFEDNETGCCPRFYPEAWDEKEFKFEGKPFMRDRTINFFHMPLNMSSMMTRAMKKIENAGAGPDGEFAILSYDPSPWRTEHYFTVNREVPGADNVKISGRFITKVFEGPYREAGKWHSEMEEYARTIGENPERIYFYYTTCPKCAEHYGKNYVVGFAKVG